MDSDDDSIFAALRAGARGYLLKEADGLDIERAIDGVARGEAVFGAGIAERVLAFFANGRQAVASPFPQLTPREHEVLEMIAQGLDNAADRPPAGAQRQDRPQPGLRHPRQAARPQPRRDGGAGPGRRTGRLSA